MIEDMIELAFCPTCKKIIPSKDTFVVDHVANDKGEMRPLDRFCNTCKEPVISTVWDLISIYLIDPSRESDTHICRSCKTTFSDNKDIKGNYQCPKCHSYLVSETKDMLEAIKSYLLIIEENQDTDDNQDEINAMKREHEKLYELAQAQKYNKPLVQRFNDYKEAREIFAKPKPAMIKLNYPFQLSTSFGTVEVRGKLKKKRIANPVFGAGYLDEKERVVWVYTGQRDMDIKAPHFWYRIKDASYVFSDPDYSQLTEFTLPLDIVMPRK